MRAEELGRQRDAGRDQDETKSAAPRSLGRCRPEERDHEREGVPTMGERVEDDHHSYVIPKIRSRPKTGAQMCDFNVRPWSIHTCFDCTNSKQPATPSSLPSPD